MRGLRAAVVAGLLGGVLPGSTGWAQTLEIAPVKILFGPDQRTASLTVTNRGTLPITMQIRSFLWRENGNVSTLTETAAIAVSPPLAEIAPGQAQAVRLLLRQPAAGSEASYRLLIDQLPPLGRPGIVSVVLRLSIPAFAEPANTAEPALEWHITTGPKGVALKVHNDGTRHATILSAQITSNGRTIPVKTATHPYVLPGADADWPIDSIRPTEGGALRIRITSDTGSQTVTAPVVSASR